LQGIVEGTKCPASFFFRKIKKGGAARGCQAPALQWYFFADRRETTAVLMTAFSGGRYKAGAL
jgi:hypothetical protein